MHVFPVMGLTPRYPVQVLQGKPYNRRCDVYSFGICLWEIYCCDMPYPDLSFADVSSAVVRQVSSLIDDLFLHCKFCLLPLYKVCNINLRKEIVS